MKNNWLVMTDGSVINAERITSTKHFDNGDRYYVYLNGGLLSSDRAHLITKEDFNLIRENVEVKRDEDRNTSADR